MMPFGGQVVSSARPANGVPPHIEAFQEVAHAELAAAPPWVPGVCFNPACSARFVLSRGWQIYCCADCKVAAKAEMRAWGYRMAMPLLIHRMGKYNRDDDAVKALVRVARRQVSQVQSAWLEDRQVRASNVLDQGFAWGGS